MVVKYLFCFGQLGVEREDGILEIVMYEFLPFIQRTLQQPVERDGRNVRMHTAVGFTRADAEWRFYDNDIFPLQG